MLNNLTIAAPADIDTELARLQNRIDRVHSVMADVLRKIDLFTTNSHMRHYVTQTPEQLATMREDLGAQLETFQDEVAPLKAEYTRRPWARYYRVDNSNGHVHTTTACRTTYTSTTFGWLPQVSGFEAEQIVELAGAMTCLVCFPTVREEILAGRPCRLETDNQRATREEREARDAEKAAKLAAKTAKTITNPDGSPLRVESHIGEIKTLRAAEMTYVDTAARLAMYDKRVRYAVTRREHGLEVNGEYAANDLKWFNELGHDCEVLLAAIAHKLGTDVETEQARFIKKVTARYNRDWA